LGVNLSPTDGKTCTFDCLYCEAGYNAQGPGTSGIPSADTVRSLLEQKLAEMASQGRDIDVITFSGNGEPTIHPQFPEIVDMVLRLRDKYFPAAKVSVLTNSTRAHIPAVARALAAVDNNIVKLDSVFNSTVRLLDRPTSPAYDTADIIRTLAAFKGKCIVQTMFTRGVHDGVSVDNTTGDEIDALIEAYRVIAPQEIMIYSIDRATPEPSLRKVNTDELKSIAARITAATGIPVLTA